VFQALEAAIRKHGRALDAFDATIQQARATVTREQQ
jgi:hypothetical protein